MEVSCVESEVVKIMHTLNECTRNRTRSTLAHPVPRASTSAVRVTLITPCACLRVTSAPSTMSGLVQRHQGSSQWSWVTGHSWDSVRAERDCQWSGSGCPRARCALTNETSTSRPTGNITSCLLGRPVGATPGWEASQLTQDMSTQEMWLRDSFLRKMVFLRILKSCHTTLWRVWTGTHGIYTQIHTTSGSISVTALVGKLETRR